MELDSILSYSNVWIKFLDYVRPACLPYVDDPDQVGDPVMLTGWGNYSSEGELAMLVVLYLIRCKRY